MWAQAQAGQADSLRWSHSSDDLSACFTEQIFFLPPAAGSCMVQAQVGQVGGLRAAARQAVSAAQQKAEQLAVHNAKLQSWVTAYEDLHAAADSGLRQRRWARQQGENSAASDAAAETLEVSCGFSWLA